MRVLHVIPYYHPAIAFGGPVTVSHALGRDLARRGHDVTVLTTDVASRDARLDKLEETIGGVRVHRLRNLSQRLAGGFNGYAPLHLQERVAQLLSAADVCHVFEYFTWMTYRAIREAAAAGVPSLLSPHGSLSLDPKRGRTLTKTVLQRTLGQATVARTTALHALTEAEASGLRGLGVPAGKIRVIPNGVPRPPLGIDDKAFRNRHGIPTHRRVVLFVGRLLSSKGVDLLIEVARRWGWRREEVFVLVGPAENRTDLARPGWYEPNLLLTGGLGGVALEEAYAAADVFALPSHSEGLPMTALEAMARGKPCVLSRACNIPEIEALGAGRLIECDAGDLSSALSDVLDSGKLAVMGARARTFVGTHFDQEVVHGAVEALYEELVRGRVT